MLFYAAALQTLNYDWDTLLGFDVLENFLLVVDEEVSILVKFSFYFWHVRSLMLLGPRDWPRISILALATSQYTTMLPRGALLFALHPVHHLRRWEPGLVHRLTDVD